MPTIELNRNVVNELVGKKLNDKDFKERVAFLGTDLEELTQDKIIIEIFPNRPDMLSEQGFARALSSFLGIKTGIREYKSNKPLKDYKVIIDKSVDEVRPFTACAIVKGIDFDEEKINQIIQLQEKLHVTFGRQRKKLAIGIYPLEQIKLPITYKALKPNEIKFHPLESENEMTGLQILSQHPTGRDYGHLLEGKDVFPIFVDANDEILSMPPIINSHKTGRVTEDTKDIFIECSGFDMHSLNLCLNMVVCALSDLGGEIYSMEVVKGNDKNISPNLSPWELDFDIDYINKILGFDLDEKQISELLAKMGIGYKKSKALIPCYRTDILHQIDLAEDIAIAYGYENVDAIIPNVATIGAEDKFEIFKRKITEILIGLNLIEVKNYHMISKKDLVDNMLVDTNPVMLRSAVSAEYNYLRTWIIPSLLKTLSNNMQYEYPQKIFEIGTCFKRNDKLENKVGEFDRLAVAFCGDTIDYTAMRQVLDYLMKMIDVEFSITDTEHSSFIPGRCARVSVKGKDVAYIGEIHPQVLLNFGLNYPVAALELNLTELFELIKEK